MIVSLPRLTYLLAGLAVLNAVWFGTKAATATSVAPSVHVRWMPGTPVYKRRALEMRYELTNPGRIGENTFAYDLVDTSRENIEALVRDPAVADTHDIDRSRYTLSPTVPAGSTRHWFAHRFLPHSMIRAVDWGLPIALGLCFGAVRYLTG